MTLSIMVGIGCLASVLVLLLLVVVAIRYLRLQHTTDGKGRPDRD